MNIALVYVARHLYHLRPFVREVFEFVYDFLGEHLFQKLTVDDLVFGYEDPAFLKLKILLWQEFRYNLTFDVKIGLLVRIYLRIP